MATDKEYSTNDETKRDKEFQNRVGLKEMVIDFLKETLISVTDSVFEKAGFKKNTKKAGEYGDKSSYGAGAVENQFIVTVAGKTKSTLTKKIIMDGKSISSDIEIVYKDNVVEFTYKTTEQGFFRGVDSNGKTFMVNEKFALDSSDSSKFKNELKNKLKKFSEKELGYMNSTKLGVVDKSDKSTSSVVENKTINMKKLTIKELFEMDMEMEPNSDKIQGLNTIDLQDTNPPIDSDKQLFFDEEQIEEDSEEFSNNDDENTIDGGHNLYDVLTKIESGTNGLFHVVTPVSDHKAVVDINGQEYKVWALDGNKLFIKGYPADNVSRSTSGENSGYQGTYENIISLINNDSAQPDSIPGTNVFGQGFSVNEITTAGPAIADSPGGYKDGAQSGAGGYNTKNAWRKTSYAQAKNKRPKITREYNKVPQNNIEETEGQEVKKSNSKMPDVTPKSSGKDTKSEQPSNKNSAVENPKSDKNFNPKTENPTWTNTNQSKAPSSSNDDFWTEVELIPGTGYVPKGMDQNFVAGMHNRTGELKKMGLAENKQVLKENTEIVDSNVVKGPDLTQKKFFSIQENKDKGINKRYLVTEKTTKEYEHERWSKLSNFKSRESIKEAEEMNNYFDFLDENKNPEQTFSFKKKLNESISHDDVFNESKITPSKDNESDTIEVEKPGSKFGITYKFLKEDFMNESTRFIHDINSQTFVKNPNFNNK